MTTTTYTPKHRAEYETDGTLYVRCLVCGFTAAEQDTIDLWNGYGECLSPTSRHEAQESLWVRTDGTRTHVTVEDGTPRLTEWAAWPSFNPATALAALDSPRIAATITPAQHRA